MRTHAAYIAAYKTEVEELIQQQLEELFTGRIMVTHRSANTITVSKLLPPAERPEVRKPVRMRMHTVGFLE